MSHLLNRKAWIVLAAIAALGIAACGQKASKPEAPATSPQRIKAVTINPAWQVRMEDKIGSLEVGEYADIVVLDRNLFNIEDPGEILDVAVLATMMDGRFTHRDGM